MRPRVAQIDYNYPPMSCVCGRVSGLNVFTRRPYTYGHSSTDEHQSD
jgi:hypothetical protein